MPMKRRAVSTGFRDFVLDRLEMLGHVTPKSMFGAVGLYYTDVFFGIVSADTLYLKVDDQTRQPYEAAGMPPFKPYSDRPGTMQYFAVPLAVLEDAEELARWARRAVEAAGRVGVRTRPAKPRGRSAGSKRRHPRRTT